MASRVFAWCMELNARICEDTTSVAFVVGSRRRAEHTLSPCAVERHPRIHAVRHTQFTQAPRSRPFSSGPANLTACTPSRMQDDFGWANGKRCMPCTLPDRPIDSSQNSLCSDGARTRPAVILQSFLCIERNHCWAFAALNCTHLTRSVTFTCFTCSSHPHHPRIDCMTRTHARVQLGGTARRGSTRSRPREWTSL
jgi:hypothetical protein